MKLKLINPRHYFSEFRQLSKFIIHPVYDTNQTLTLPQRLEGTWTMFVVKFVLTIIVGISVGIFYDPENLTKSSMADRFSTPMLFLMGVFVLPMLEEVVFRLSLKFKPIYLAMTLSVLGYYITCKAIYHTKLSDFEYHIVERISISLIILVASYLLISIPKIKKSLKLFWINNFRWILYFFCFGFAWVHIFNYELTWEHLLLMPIITLDKLVSAMCYGYARINYGFIYSFLIHALNNTIGLIVNLLSSGSD